jgi:hypothetical protein
MVAASTESTVNVPHVATQAPPESQYETVACPETIAAASAIGNVVPATTFGTWSNDRFRFPDCKRQKLLGWSPAGQLTFAIQLGEKDFRLAPPVNAAVHDPGRLAT